MALHGDEPLFVESLLLADDQHVLVDGAVRTVARRFAPPVPGRCPRLTVGRWSTLGERQVTFVGGFVVGDDSAEGTSWTVVCDRPSGRLMHVEPEAYEYTHYCSIRRTTPRLASVGPWLLLEREVSEGGGGLCEPAFSRFSTTLVDTTSGTRFGASGGLVGPGAPARPFPGTLPLPPPEIAAHAGQWPAAVVRDGAVAWAAALTGGGYMIHLSDAAGTRPVGRATDAHLTLDDALRWTENGAPQSAPVAPDRSWAPATAVTLRR
ncbi:hypothetical protein SK069_11150 [Patulibacter brassicae]|uniref:Uncharacterized protein n=1 Tax=Patulibacter brassicae TaxID=1705717 RepID=A0ABU4VK13_9ACTN|nr:hypothetical protein [Patulibacter brassicae]MDX8152153.1 hypothetical protein [Patulibacter brassicae]